MNTRISATNVGWIALALTVATAFVWLGNWQLNRADEKRQMYTSFQQRGGEARINLNDHLYSDKPAREMAGFSVSADGHYTNENVLLDNQVNAGRVGYMVYTPLEISNAGYSILINRGWVAIPEERDRVPEIVQISGPVHVAGRASRPAAAGLALRGSDQVERLDANNLRLQRIDLASLAKRLEVPLAPYTLLLDPDAGSGFAREWRIPGSGEKRHLGYAFQWFAMAATVIVVCAVLLCRAGRK